MKMVYGGGGGRRSPFQSHDRASRSNSPSPFPFERRPRRLPEKGQIVPRSNIDNRLQQVSIGKTSIGVDFFLPLCRFAALLYAGNLFHRFDMRLTEGQLKKD